MRPMDANKTDAFDAVAMISNCDAQNHRLEVVAAMQKLGVRVQTHGKCFDSGLFQGDRIEELARYKFTLAFENSFADDYVRQSRFCTDFFVFCPFIAFSLSLSLSRARALALTISPSLTRKLAFYQSHTPLPHLQPTRPRRFLRSLRSSGTHWSREASQLCTAAPRHAILRLRRNRFFNWSRRRRTMSRRWLRKSRRCLQTSDAIQPCFSGRLLVRLRSFSPWPIFRLSTPIAGCACESPIMPRSAPWRVRSGPWNLPCLMSSHHRTFCPHSRSCATRAQLVCARSNAAIFCARAGTL